ncbi:P22 phage major capsid protein family protein [Cytobacillus sp. IB215665]|uniref:P22 phage major capsid protein family protein n=1 Tax=Cytobacillus sp. IB215665 TaxID=3097357 RepID=UPI002A1092F6|nr:P22 phage major capsid protein family protein [Cytobacillus sp. IB215665]MDX8367853.1 P22 phage major capsid protein family protein [Cytobacillus sp. IB215665]
MSYANFMPTIWSARLNANLRKALVYGNIVNTDYEGEIAGVGSTVRINTMGAVTIGDYDKDNGVGDPETLDSDFTTLTLDQQKFFNFKVDDIDKAQTRANLVDLSMGEASYGLADVMDQYIASFYTEAASTMGSDASPLSVTKDNIYDYIVDLNVLLSEKDVPKMGRFVVLPEFCQGLLQKNPLLTKEPQVVHDAYVGNIAGTQIFTSNNVPNNGGEKYKVLAGHRMAISFAQSIDSLEAYRPEKYFADAVKGLQFYGAKVIKPEALAVMTINR